MKKTGLTVFLLLFTVLASAQQTTLVQVLERDVPGKGQIRIERDARLDSLIGTVSEAESGTKIKARGYRIQVFAGNNTRASKERANEVDRYIRAKYPDLPVHTEFRNPRWLCTVWKTMPICLLRMLMFVMSSPSMIMLPPCGTSMPAISESNVLFPLPEGPIMHRSSPLSIEKERFIENLLPKDCLIWLHSR